MPEPARDAKYMSFVPPRHAARGDRAAGAIVARGIPADPDARRTWAAIGR